METERILDELTHYERLPVDAIRAASADREAIIPRLIQAFQSYVNDPKSMSPDLLFLAFHLLGEWRATSSYRPLVRFLRLSPSDLEPVLGDATTETSHRVMAAVFDGDPQPLYDVIRDSAADEYIRSRTYDALALVTLQGFIPREETIRFLRASFSDLEAEQESFVLERLAERSRDARLGKVHASRQTGLRRWKNSAPLDAIQGFRTRSPVGAGASGCTTLGLQARMHALG